jgi:hypothetical protein
VSETGQSGDSATLLGCAYHFKLIHYLQGRMDEMVDVPSNAASYSTK